MATPAFLPENSMLCFKTKKAVYPLPNEWDDGMLCFAVQDTHLSTDYGKYTVRINGRPQDVLLQKIDSTDRLCVPWLPASAGRYYYSVARDEKELCRDSFTILPAKISEENFRQLIHELQNDLPHGIALAVQEAGGLAGVNLAVSPDKMWQDEFQLLKRALYGQEGHSAGLPASSKNSKELGLLKVLQALRREHHRRFSMQEPWVQRHAARRPSIHGLVRAYARTGNMEEVKQGFAPHVLQDCRVEHDADVYENRVVRHVCEHVAYRLRRLSRFARISSSPVSAGIKNQLTEFCAVYEREREQTTFLDEVSLLHHLPTELTQVQMHIPAYQQSVQLLQILRKTLPVEPWPVERAEAYAPLASLPQLYQDWCSLTVIHMLLQICLNNGLRRAENCYQLIIKKEHAFCIVFPAGRPLLQMERGDLRLTCFVERTYSATSGGHYTSLSNPMRPDISIEIQRGNERPVLLLLDAKYKLQGETLLMESSRYATADIDKMHVYRDAIRHRKDLIPCVEFAGILFPGTSWQAPSKAVAAFTALPSNKAALAKELNELLRPYLQ